MVYIPGGTFTMGSDNPDFVEEKIAEDVTVSSFCIEPHEVTNAQFAKFVDATGYVTVAERPLSQEQFPNLDDEERAPGSLVFQPPEEGIQQVAYLSWWHWQPGANWRHPFGSDSDIQGKAIIPSSTLPMKMRKPMPSGAIASYPPKPSGNMRLAAATTSGPTPGANNIPPSRPIPGRACFPFSTPRKMGTWAPRQRCRFRPMATVCTT
jgi:hypothetical protein